MTPETRAKVLWLYTATKDPNRLPGPQTVYEWDDTTRRLNDALRDFLKAHPPS